MTSARNRLTRDDSAHSATGVFMVEDESPRIRKDGDRVMLHPGPIPRVAMGEFWRSCGSGPAAS